jgi:hypothetical protein
MIATPLYSVLLSSFHQASTVASTAVSELTELTLPAAIEIEFKSLELPEQILVRTEVGHVGCCLVSHFAPYCRNAKT